MAEEGRARRRDFLRFVAFLTLEVESSGPYLINVDFLLSPPRECRAGEALGSLDLCGFGEPT